jgi:Hemerythrin HHE cation binding domain
MASKCKSNVRKSNVNGRRTSRPTGRGNAGRRHDAIGLLKADHRQVASWFEQFKKSRVQAKKAELAESICQALRIHTQIEEEIFYPAFLEAANDKDIHHEAEVEHAGAKNLISEIEQAGPDDEYFDARIKVLAEMIRHHVKEEEKPDGMFAKARRADMPLGEIGERLEERKTELQGTMGNRMSQQRTTKDSKQVGMR